jgi:2-oxoisovalerate ferredoxin oxidoreductase beta subunit
MIKHEKPRSFYNTFDRKGDGQKTTHYCPGCGHGTVQKLIAECIDELGIQDRTVFLSPVGCAVFAYYYFDTGNIQCSHGRAPAVATGVRRTLEDAIIISYQGDGDLAGIGTTEIIHAASRGENITVFFINNAIYGMTGGQMAPTTLLGQKTLTTPNGRTMEQDGAPIAMAEIMDAIKAPVYIERVSLASVAKVMKTRKAIKQALQNQIEKKGFSFVEILSPCPINWKMEPVQSRTWIEKNLEPVFPVRKFRDLSAGVAPVSPACAEVPDAQLLDLFKVEKEIPRVVHREPVVDQYVKISGFGGQGVMSAGVLLANCAAAEGLNTAWLPSYGPEMRGGTANASVVIANSTIGSPVVDHPNALIAMNIPSLDAFGPAVTTGGLILVNSSIVQQKVLRSDVRALYIPASQMAHEEGLLTAANVIILAVYILTSHIVDIATLQAIIPLSIKNKRYIDINMRMVQRAISFYGQQ